MPSVSSGPRALLRRAVLITIAAVSLGITAPPALAADYVAMGDSYASGTGTRDYSLNAACERSPFAYANLIRTSFGSSFSFRACGGAKVQDVIDDQVESLDSGTDYVSISIGGNDAGFSSVITKCAQPVVSCSGEINSANGYIDNTLPGRLNTLYDQIRANAPNAVVAVVGYPRLFNNEDCNAFTFFSGDEMTSLNATADRLAGVTRTQARANGFTFVDARPAFLGHAVCEDEWLNGLASPTSESYHPNRTGHSSGFAGIVRAAMQAAPKPNAPNGGVGRIAFTSDRSGNDDVWVANADGQFPENLTDNPADDIDAAWSPDGTKIAFASNRDGDNEIYVASGDGTNVVKLTSNTSDDREPAWSPNGAYIAFRSDRTGNNEVFRMTAAGGSQTNITNSSGSSDFAPDWSPDGAEIAYQRFITGQNNEILKANADGQGKTNLTNNGANDGRPAWSPDGATLAFHSNRTGSQFDIYTMPSAGGTATQRTTNAASDSDPAYSPTGAQIAFNSSRTGNNELFTMTSTGGSQTARATSAGSDTNPSWQADSTPPATTVTGPTGPTKNGNAKFTIGSSEKGSTLQCRIDSAAYAPCSSPYIAGPLSDGEHTFSVRAIDPANNTDPSPATSTFVVDTTAPAVQVQCPGDVVLGTTVHATVQATDAGGFAAIDDPTGEHALDTSAPGPQTFSIQAIDQAGNTGSGQCSYLVRYPDPGAPRLSAGDATNRGDFAVGWDAVAPADLPLTYEIQRRDADDSDWTPIAQHVTDLSRAFTDFTEGTWTFRIRGVDTTNDLETAWSPPSDAIKVDRSGPRAPQLSADRAPEYASDGGWFRDEATVSTADAGDPDLPDGSSPSGVDPDSIAAPERVSATTTLSRTVLDRLGNRSDEGTLRVQIDSESPKLALDCPATVELLDDVAVKVTASDAQSGLRDDPTGDVTVDTDTVGPQVIERTAVDNVGHSTTESCTVAVKYPTPGAPEVTDGTNPNAGDFTLGWTRSAPAGYPLRYELERRSDGGEWSPVADGLANPTRAFARGDSGDEGTWTYRVRGVDGENDEETPWSALSAPVKVDQTAPAKPAITADDAPEYAGDGGWFRDEVTLTTTDNGDPDLRDGSAPTGVDPDSIAAPRTLDHSTTLRRTVSDRVGNESDETALLVQVDPTAPTVELDCPRSVLLGGRGVVAVTASDADSGLATDPTGEVVVDTDEVGVQEIKRTAVDNVGHRTTESCEVVVRYAYSGLAAPFAEDGRTTFKAGSTIPLKFALADAAREGVAGAEYEVELARGDEVVEAGEIDDDGKHGKYHFNLSTRGVEPGEWTLRIRLDDSTIQRAPITLR